MFTFNTNIPTTICAMAVAITASIFSALPGPSCLTYGYSSICYQTRSFTCLSMLPVSPLQIHSRPVHQQFCSEPPYVIHSHLWDLTDIPTVYTNSLLVTLNSRGYIRKGTNVNNSSGGTIDMEFLVRSGNTTVSRYLYVCLSWKLKWRSVNKNRFPSMLSKPQ